MKRFAAIASVLLACGSCAPAPAPTKPAVQERLEQLAGELSYFSAREFALGQTAKVAPDRGRHFDSGLPVIRHRRAAERMYESAARITRELAWHDWDVDELEALLDHSDAKVRTLAAAALFATDDPQNRGGQKGTFYFFDGGATRGLDYLACPALLARQLVLSRAEPRQRPR